MWEPGNEVWKNKLYSVSLFLYLQYPVSPCVHIANYIETQKKERIFFSFLLKIFSSLHSDLRREDGERLQGGGLWLAICGENGDLGAAPLWESYYW